MYPNGPIKVFLTLAKFLRKLEHEVVFWYFDERDGADVSDGKKISFFQFPGSENFDVVQSVGLRPDLFVRFWRRKIAQPAITTMENYVEQDLSFEYSPMISKLFSPVWKGATKKHDGFVVLQSHMKAYYENNWGVENPEIIANCSESILGRINEEVQKTIVEFKNNSNILLGSIGSVTERKGIKQIVRLLKIRRELKWVHFGDGKDLESTKEFAKESGVDDRILFLGKVPDASSYLPLVDLFLMPSYSEGMPLAMLEAVMQKKPCVSTNIDIFKAIFSSYETGQFEPDNIEEFSNVIDEVLKNKGNFIENSYRKYSEEYSPAVVAKKYVDFYSKLILAK